MSPVGIEVTAPPRLGSVTVPAVAGEDAARALCLQLLPSWSTVAAASLEVSVISGGITNSLLKVTPPEGSGLDPVVIRTFGDNTEKMIDREEELEKILKLNAHGFGAKVLGIFGNGRVEEFLQGRILSIEEMQDPALQAKVATRMAEFHSLLSLARSQECTLWTTLQSWMDTAKTLKFEDEQRQAAFEKLELDAFQADIMLVKAALESLGSPMVLSHNDLLNGNIMILEGGALQFIDFEYGGTNYRGFDFGNHFNEFAGFDCDYTCYPQPDVQRRFIGEYLKHSHPGGSVPPEEVEQVYMEANVAALASHLFWGLWAILQAKFSNLDFDYIEYAQMRYDEYKRRKDEFLALVPKKQ
mmetsp:Transcript_36037/g.102033  ORF Transcript_36037/g.102033 Transcript_36037/m.102033 type:complete len:356 (-) Transcript_36037:154-1221(-)